MKAREALNMLTKINMNLFCRLYEISPSNFYNITYRHRAKLNSLATWYHDRSGKKRKRRDFNAKQLSYLVNEVFAGEQPLNYTFNGNTFIKNKEEL